MLLFLLSVVIVLQQDSLAQSTTNQNGQQVPADQSFFDVIRNGTFMRLDTLPHFPVAGAPVKVMGELSTYFLFPSVSVSSVSYSPLADAEVRIFLLNATDYTIVNTTTARTDSFGFFMADMRTPNVPTTIPAGPSPEPPFLIFAYFEGNENSFPTSGWIYVFSPQHYSLSSLCPSGVPYDPSEGACRQPTNSTSQTNSTGPMR
jgi:hypothetical protein